MFKKKYGTHQLPGKGKSYHREENRLELFDVSFQRRSGPSEVTQANSRALL